LDLAFNSNALHQLCSSGADGTLRFWDLRKSNRCLLQFEDEQQGHWLTKLKYNQFHDQLVLTGSTSTFVSLYRAISVSSQPQGSIVGIDLNNTNTFNMSIGDSASNGGRSFSPMLDPLSGSSLHGSNSKVTDKLVQSYELEDTVTAIEWSAAEAWVFAALSYNGTMSINMVPSKEKYRILL
jgi:EARP and GARP complex-interacting protein 1